MILTGKPGTGKTTLIIELLEFLRTNHPQWRIIGFYSKEVRKKGKRIGFDLISIDGKRGTLARTDEFFTGIKKTKFGRYYLNLDELDKFSSKLSMKADLVVIDEIGKMEIMSSKFRSNVLWCFQNSRVLCTMGQFFNPFIDQILQFPNIIIYTITNENRKILMTNILNQICEDTG
ncbi:nucleoside-triphosphatase [Candidatus Hodarchaeum mangrovi]